ncbi:hypothetical protein CONLIGDRAFT_639848 [Coniochaeta ligniaria NRRL 30616]|uniref:Protein kinase domain-containing protein n=1 Tax=Coniochaeta ligniaria NRRL 30616 TaxID=1408157 RepID=A0A1J7JZJ9_9PEZI|nr:hypothetical protein CONLIGDRAFT_639848 [Coniochaeta ligniaria NRRL 30616]
MSIKPVRGLGEYRTHITDLDIDFIVRTNNGCVFDCRVDPKHFLRSPNFTKEYLKCLYVLRRDEDESVNYTDDDAKEFLEGLFETTITERASQPPPLPPHGRPSLAQYIFAPPFYYTLDVVDDDVQPREIANPSVRWQYGTRVSERFMDELRRWTKITHPADVQIYYNKPGDFLIKPPKRVIVACADGGETVYFFKRIPFFWDWKTVKPQLRRLEKVTAANVSPGGDARLCRVHRVVADGRVIHGVLMDWIDKKTDLDSYRWSMWMPKWRPARNRHLWAAQIERTLEYLHHLGVVWVDASPRNVIIDRAGNAWITGFESPHFTHGYVDEQNISSVEGDRQCLAKMKKFLSIEKRVDKVEF